ncbi:glycosyltransferase family 4 protein [Pseudomonas sp. D(2018)]|uniref:glycosyltransferase family 4 protein n=1 Tax=Pseudomonas sp. D(2018) TaxID=2502238 RepID=UPI0010FA4836|nr:glycosyltransferase family 4 protein [Pseudomonas sp. D(2018)]
MNSIVVICQHFVPYTPAVGGVARVWYLIDYLSKNGFKVYVVTSDGAHYGALGFPAFSGNVEVIYLRDPVKKFIQSGIKESASSGGRRVSWRMRFMVKTRAFFEELMIPDPGIFVVFKYLKAVSRLVVDKNIKNVFVSSPPHSIQLVGLLLKARFGKGVNVVADYRDSWNSRVTFRKKTFVGNKISCWMERRIVNSVNYITYASSPIFEKLTNLCADGISSKGVLVMNGFPREPIALEKPESLPGSVVRIGHFGIVNDEVHSYRNIEPIIRAIEKARASGTEIILELYGSARFSRLDMDDFPFVSIFGSLSHDSALEKMTEMDYLLMFHMEVKDSEEIVTGKFFDYVSARRPILCVSPRGMEGARLVREHEFGVCADSENEDDVVRQLVKLKDHDFSGLYSRDDISKFSRASQYEKILSILK